MATNQRPFGDSQKPGDRSATVPGSGTYQKGTCNHRCPLGDPPSNSSQANISVCTLTLASCTAASKPHLTEYKSKPTPGNPEGRSRLMKLPG
jgi:hypothetical protein